MKARIMKAAETAVARIRLLEHARCQAMAAFANDVFCAVRAEAILTRTSCVRVESLERSREGVCRQPVESCSS
jgi:hypothetical protein